MDLHYAKEITRSLEKLLSRFPQFFIILEYPDQTSTLIKNSSFVDPKPIHLEVHSYYFFTRIAIDQLCGLSLAFMNGEVSCNDWPSFFSLFTAKDLFAYNSCLQSPYSQLQINIPFFKSLTSETDGSFIFSQLPRVSFQDLVSKLEIKAGDRILEIGTGLGSFSSFLAKQIDCQVISLTSNPIQHDFMQKWIEINQLQPRFVTVEIYVGFILRIFSRLQVKLVDSFQQFAEETPGKFDKIVSLEGLVEFSNSASDLHMILQKCKDMLAPGGLLFVQLVCENSFRPLSPQQRTFDGLPFGNISINHPASNSLAVRIHKVLEYLDKSLTNYVVNPHELRQRHKKYLSTHLLKKTLQHQSPSLQSILQVFSESDQVKAEYISTSDCIETVKQWSRNFQQASQLLSNKEECKMWALQLALTQALLTKEVLVVLQLTYQN